MSLNNLRKNKFFSGIAALTFILLQSNIIYAQEVIQNALPQGATDVTGGTTYTYNGNTLNQVSTANKSITDWQSANVGAVNTWNIVQPSSSSVSLNRVVGVDPSSVYGNITSNGRFFLVNPNGVFFGAGSHVDVNGLVASTLNITNSDFLNNTYNFCQNGKAAYVINNGTITVPNGGFVALLSNAVNNSGTIVANLGKVALAAGEKMTVALDDSSDISVTIDEAVKNGVFGPDGQKITDAIKNSGSIQADGGKVILNAKVLNNIFDYAVNNSGVIQAKGLVNHNGTIELTADGGNIIAKNGSVITTQASDSTAQGGTVTVRSTNDVNIEKGAVIDVSGGSVSGDAGSVDISTDGNLDFAGTLNGFAADGYKIGDFLLDPAATTISGFLFGNTTIWSLKDITIAGDVYLLVGGTLNLYADHKNSTTWDDGIGSILDPGKYTIFGGIGSSTLNLKAGSGIGSASNFIQVSGLSHVSAEINPASSSGGIYLNNTSLVAPLSISSISTPNGDINLSSILFGIDLGGNVHTGNGTVTLNVPFIGGVNQSAGGITATNLVLTGNGDFDLNSATNDVGTLAANIGLGHLVYRDANTLTVGTVAGVNGITSSNNSVTLNTGDALTLNNTIDAGTNTITLNSQGGAFQFGAGYLTSKGLLLTGKGPFFLLNNANNVGTLAANIDGSLISNYSGPLTIGTVNGINGVTTTDNSVITTNKDVLLTQDLNVGAHQLQLVGAGITQTGGKVVADSLYLQGNTVSLTSATNSVNTLAAFTQGDLTFTNASALTIGTVNLSGINTNSHNVTLNTGNTLTLNKNVKALGSTVKLNSNAGGITENGGAITAANLLLTGNGNSVLNANNVVNTIAANVNGSVSYTNAGSLSIGSVAGTDGITAKSVAVTATTGDLTVNKDVLASAGTINLTSSVGDLTVNANIADASNTISLNAGNDFIQNGGEIWSSSGKIDIEATRDAVLAGNAYTSLNDFILNAGRDITQNGGTVGLGHVTLTAGRDITQNFGYFTGSNLTLKATRDIIQNTGYIQGWGGAASDNLVLDAGNEIKQNASGNTVIFANNLELKSVNGIGNANAIKTIASNLKATNTTSGDINVSNAGALTLSNLGSGNAVSNAGGKVNIQNDSTMTVKDTVTASGTVTLGANGASSDLILNGNVEDGSSNISLNAGQDFIQNSSSEVWSSSGKIDIEATRDAILAGNAYTGLNDFILNAGRDITQNGGTVGLGHVTLTAGRDITQNGGGYFTGSTLTLKATRDIIQHSGYIQGWGGAASDNLVLDAGNEIKQDASGTTVIKATNLELKSVNGTGNTSAIKTIASNLKATNTSTGDINISNTGALTLSNLGSGNAVTNANGKINIQNDSTLTVKDTVTTTTGGTITLGASGASSDLILNGNIEDGMSDISLSAGRDFIQNLSEVWSVYGKIDIEAANDAKLSGNAYTSLSDLIIHAGHDVTQDGGTIGLGVVKITGDHDVIQNGGIFAGSDLTVKAGHDIVQNDRFQGWAGSATNMLLDAGNQIKQGANGVIKSVNLTLKSVNGIGTGVGNAIKTIVSNLQALNTTSGDINVKNTGGLTLTDLTGAGAAVSNPNGNINISAASPLTINSAVTAGGDITLTAAGTTVADDLTVNADITSTSSGLITLNAGHDFIQNSGDISTGGDVIINANNDINQIGGTITSNGLSLSAGGNVTFTSLALSLIAANVAGDFKLTNTKASGLTIGHVGTIDGITAKSVDVTETAGNLTVAKAVSATNGTVKLTSSVGNLNVNNDVSAGSQDITLNAGNNYNQSTGSVSTTGKATINASNDIVQTGGSVDANTLKLEATNGSIYGAYTPVAAQWSGSNFFKTSAKTLDLSAGNSITLADTGSVDSLAASTTSGPIDVVAYGDLKVQNVSAPVAPAATVLLEADHGSLIGLNSDGTADVTGPYLALYASDSIYGNTTIATHDGLTHNFLNTNMNGLWGNYLYAFAGHTLNLYGQSTFRAASVGAENVTLVSNQDLNVGAVVGTTMATLEAHGGSVIGSGLDVFATPLLNLFATDKIYGTYHPAGTQYADPLGLGLFMTTSATVNAKAANEVDLWDSGSVFLQDIESARMTLVANNDITIGKIIGSAGSTADVESLNGSIIGTPLSGDTTPTISAQNLYLNAKNSIYSQPIPVDLGGGLTLTTISPFLNVAVDNITAKASDYIDIANTNVNGVTINSLSSNNDIAFFQYGGNVGLGQIQTNGNVQLIADGAIIDNNGALDNIVANAAWLEAVKGIGSSDAVETKISQLHATNTNNDINIVNTGSLTIAPNAQITYADLSGEGTLGGGVSNTNGNVNISTHSPLIVNGSVVASGNVNLTAGGTTPTDNLTVNADVKSTSAGKITLNGGHDVVQNSGTVSTTGDVDLEAGNDINQTGGKVTANNLTMNAVGNINEAKSNDAAKVTAHSTVAGTINYNDTNAVELVDVTTKNGSINVTAGGNLKATNVVSQTSSAANSITLNASSLLGSNVSLVNVDAGLSGDVNITASGLFAQDVDAGTGGSVVTANNLKLRASTGIGASNSLDVTVNNVDAQTTVGNVDITNHNALGGTATALKTNFGDINFNQIAGPLHVVNANTAVGNLTLTSAGHLTVDSGTGSGTVKATSTGDAVDITTLKSTLGSVQVTAKTDVTAATISAFNNIDVTATNGKLQLTNATTTLGNIGLKSGTDTSLVAGGTVKSGKNITVTAGNNINLAGILQAANNILLNAGAAISQTAGKILGKDLNAQAVGSITANQSDNNVNTLTANSTGAGNISYHDTNAVTLTSVKTANGSITVSAGDTITSNDVESLTDNDANDIALTASSGNIVNNGPINAGVNSGDVTLTATNGSITGAGLITGDLVSFIAASGVGTSGSAIKTSANTIDASVTGAGLVNINETDSVTLNNVKTANGGITVKAAGTITTNDVESLTDSDDNDIALTATSGDIVNHGTINAGNTGDVTLTATLGSILDPLALITGDVVTLTAANGIGDDTDAINTSANTINANVTGAGLINLNETDAVTLNNVTTANGKITVKAGGTITAINVISTTDNDANDITLTATTGNIIVGIVNAGLTAGDVNLTATTGSILGSSTNPATTLVTGDVETLNAKTGIGSNATPLNTAANSINANVSGAGLINLNETDAVTLNNVKTANGMITVNAGGTITTNNVTSLTDNDANDIALTATAGDIINHGVINAGNSGDVTLTATLGSILDPVALITGDVVTLTAANGIGTDLAAINTKANTIDANVTGTGLINLNETDAVNLHNVTTANGKITVNAGGNITATNVVSQTSSSANSITLKASSLLGSNVNLVNVDAGLSGDVNITASGLNAQVFDAGTGGSVVTANNLKLRASTGIGASNSLDVTVNNVDAQTTVGKVDITNHNALGGTATALKTNFGDINFNQIAGSLHVVNANTAVGNLTLTSAGHLTVDNGTGSGTVKATSTGDAVDITTLKSTLGSVQVTAKTDVTAATISAFNNIDVNATTGKLQLTNATTTFGNIGLKSGTDTNLVAGGTVKSGKNITVTAGNDINLAGILQAANNIILSAGAAISQTAGKILGKDLNAQAVGSITLNGPANDVNTLTAKSSGTGDILYNDANSVTLTDVSTNNGTVTVTAGGTINANKVSTVSGDSTGRDITLTANNDVNVKSVNAGTTGDAHLTATNGSIIGVDNGGAVNLTANAAYLKAFTSIYGAALPTTLFSNNGGLGFLKTSVSDITAEAGTRINIFNTTDVKLTDVKTTGSTPASIDILNTGNMNVLHVADVNDVTLEATGDIIGLENEGVNVDTKNLYLSAGGDIYGAYTPEGLNFADNAGNVGFLTTSASDVTAKATNRINLYDSGDVTLDDVETTGTSPDSVYVAANGNIGVDHVADSNDVTLEALNGSIVGNNDGDFDQDVDTLNLYLSASDSITGDYTPDGLTYGDHAGGNGFLTTNATDITAKATNRINLYDSGNVTLDNVETTAGTDSKSVYVAASGNIYVNHVADSNDVTLEALDGSVIGNNDGDFNADVETANLYLFASDSITGDYTPDGLTYGDNAGGQGFLTTNASNIWATSGNRINIYDTGSVTLKDVVANGKTSIDIAANGNINVDHVSDPLDVTLEALDGSVIGNNNGDFDADVETANLYLFASDSITGDYTPDGLTYGDNAGENGFLTTNATDITAKATNRINLYDSGDVTLDNVETTGTSPESVYVAANGNIYVNHVADSNDVTLEALDGSVIGNNDGDFDADVETANLYLFASDSITGDYTPDGLFYGDNAGRSGFLTTNATDITAKATNRINLYDSGDVTLDNVETTGTSPESVYVAASGNIYVNHVSDSNDVTLEALDGSIIGNNDSDFDADVETANLYLFASDSITGDFTPKGLTYGDNAGTQGFLTTNASHINAHSGDRINLYDSGDVTLDDVESSFKSKTSVDVVANGSINVGYVFDPLDVTLEALNGSIIGLDDSEVDVNTQNLYLSASDSIYGKFIPRGLFFGDNTGEKGFLRTNASNITAQAGTRINLYDTGATTLTNVETFGTTPASIDVVANGDITVNRVFDANDVTLESQNGSIFGVDTGDNNIVTGNLSLFASDNIGSNGNYLKTDVEFMDVKTIGFISRFSEGNEGIDAEEEEGHGDVFLANAGSVEVNSLNAGGEANLITGGSVILDNVTTEDAFTLEVLNGDILINQTVQSTEEGVILRADHGSIYGTAKNHVIAHGDSLFSTPEGTIGLTDPIDVDITGNLLLDIGGRVGKTSGVLTGVITSPDANIPLIFQPKFPSPLRPPGNVFFNGVRIWPSVSTFAISQTVASSLNQFVFPSATQLATSQVNTFDVASSATQGGPIFLYHPLTELDSGSFNDEFQLDEGAYDFIEGEIKKKGTKKQNPTT